MRQQMSDTSWLIIGGGIHGVHVATRLIGDGNVARERVRILDPDSQLLARWRAFTSITGMTHLRSPSVHHLDRSAFSLQRFAGKPKRRPPGLFAAPYDRPSLSLFNAHCEKVIAEYGLEEIHVRAKAEGITVNRDGVSVSTCQGRVQADRIVLAIGAGGQPEWPSWAPKGDDRVMHIFGRNVELPARDSSQQVLVVGGGISAVQLAVRLSTEGQRVHLVSRHPLRKHLFDSDPGWLGPRYMTRFARESCMQRRRVMITKARRRGSVTPDTRRALTRAINRRSLTRMESDIAAVLGEPNGLVAQLSNGTELRVGTIYLATGFATARPGGKLLDDLIEAEQLPCAPCGYPIVNPLMRWHPRIYVTGPLAELELGPSARNIAGARNAAARVVQAARRASS